MYILRSNFETAQVVVEDPSAAATGGGQEKSEHGRVTVMTVGAPAFDQLLQRTLAAPAGHHPAAQQQQGCGGWTAKPPSLTVEGNTWISHDFILKAGVISHRGEPR